MVRRSLWVLAALIPLAVSTSAIAQQAQNSPPPQAGSPPQTNSWPSLSLLQPAANGAPTAPPGYQQPPNPQQHSQPPASYQPPPGHVEDQIAPYHVHRDARYGHNHVYPDRGSIARELPRGALTINYAGISYRFYDGVWFEPRGPAFMVVSPPIGLVVSTLPAFATGITSGGESYLYANDVYYLVRPDIGGYEVVNEPEQSAAVFETPAPVPPPSPPPPAASAALLAPAAAVAAAGPPAATPAALITPAGALGATTAPAAAAAPIPPVPAPGPPPPSVAAAMTVPAVSTATPVTSAASAPLLPSRAAKVFAYPRNGQTAEQQARDQYECYRFAVAQTGFDPLRPNAAVAGSQASAQQSDFERAQAACFDARGYTIR